MDVVMESVMWQVIEDMNFNKRGHNGAGLYLTNESGLSLDGMRKVESFARRKCGELYKQLFDVTGVSDDSYDDLRLTLRSAVKISMVDLRKHLSVHLKKLTTVIR